MVKNYVIDTNILLDYPDAMFGFGDENNVIITSTVIKELDTHKSRHDIVGANVRKVIRTLDELGNKGDLLKGIPLPNGGTLKIEPDGINRAYLPENSAFDVSVPDVQIISSCLYIAYYKNSNVTFDPLTDDVQPDPNVILVTNDANMRLMAKCCKVKAQPYNNSIIEVSDYKGYIDINVPDKIISALYSDGKVNLDDVMKFIPEDEKMVYPNEFITMHGIENPQGSALSVYRHDRIELIDPSQNAGWVRPKNVLQSYALWALQQPVNEIPLVILAGPAGTAKTFLSIAVGIEKILGSQKNSECEYEKIILARPMANSFKEIGALPGDIDQKLAELHASFNDAIAAYYRREGNDITDVEINAQVNDLYSSGKIENCALSFIRGRSIPYSYIICDECQNSTKTLVRDVVTRAALGSRCILSGDAQQIDLPYVDKNTNGLTFAIESMKGSPKMAYIQFTEDQAVRSELATEAIKRMKI